MRWRVISKILLIILAIYSVAKCETTQTSKYRNAIYSVLQQYDDIQTEIEKKTEKMNIPKDEKSIESLSLLSKEIDKIALHKCPHDFIDAFAKHRNSVKNFVVYYKKTIKKAGTNFIYALGIYFSIIDVEENINNQAKIVLKDLDNVFTTAEKYGVDVSKFK